MPKRRRGDSECRAASSSPRAAERWLDALDDDGTTEAINAALVESEHDHAFTDAAASSLAANDHA